MTDSQVQGLEQICDQFKKGVEHSSRCQDRLKSLENATDGEFERRARSIFQNREENTDKLKRTARSVVGFAFNLN